MSNTDGIVEPNKEKNLGKIQFTYEMIPNILLMDQRMRFIDTYTDPKRQIVSFIFESDEPFRSTMGQTFSVKEAQEIPNFNPIADYWIEAMRERVKAWDDMKQQEKIDGLVKKAMEHLKNIEKRS